MLSSHVKRSPLLWLHNKSRLWKKADLVFHWCLYNKQNITYSLMDMNFIFSCSTRYLLSCLYLTSEISSWTREDKIHIHISTCGHVISSMHFVFNISSEIIQDNQITVSFDVEWLLATVPVKDSVLVQLAKLESYHETKPFRPHDADIFTNCLTLGFLFKISAVYVQQIQLQTTRWCSKGGPCACSNS